MKKLHYLFLITFVTQAQIALHGDVYLPAHAQVAFHAPSHFLSGIVHTDASAPGAVAFSTVAHGLSPAHDTHIDAAVNSLGHSDFTFPVGNKGNYQPLGIADSDGGSMAVQFHHQAHSTTERVSDLKQLAAFYWAIDAQNNATMRLAWNSFSGIDQLADDTAALRIAGLNGSQWEIIPAVIDPYALDGTTPVSISDGAISTTAPVDWSAYTAVTIAAAELDTELRVAEGITPNNDGRNDRWVIHNIERYPNAVIRVYNRWGAQVFQANGNYQNDWDATYNNNSKILPEGPYYYRIDLDGDGTTNRDGWIYINH